MSDGIIIFNGYNVDRLKYERANGAKPEYKDITLSPQFQIYLVNSPQDNSCFNIKIGVTIHSH